MYSKLGVGPSCISPGFESLLMIPKQTQWATSLLGFLALAFVPAPILLWKYGAKIRKMSKYSPTA